MPMLVSQSNDDEGNNMSLLACYLNELHQEKLKKRLIYDSAIRERFPELQQYFDRIDRDEHPRRVLRSYTDAHLKGKRFVAVFKTNTMNEQRILHVYPKFGDHLASSFLKMTREEQKKIAKRTLIGLSKIDEILKNGSKTVLLDPKDPLSHTGWKFMTVISPVLDEDGHKFPVKVEIKLAIDVIDKDRIHHLNVKGSDTFNCDAKDDTTTLKGKFLMKGETVEIEMMPDRSN